MSGFIVKYVSRNEMLAIEREADASGLSYIAMMENAGRGLGEVVEARFASTSEKSIMGLIGPGNNGGDTLVGLTYLIQRGWRASAYLVKPRPSDDPLVSRYTSLGGILYSVDEDRELHNLDTLIHSHSVLLDGILGTGFKLPLRNEIGKILSEIRRMIEEADQDIIVVAVDCPSGVDADSGAAADETIPADFTVTMAAMKRGLLRLPAFELCGEIEIVSIGLTDKQKTWNEIDRFVIQSEWVQENLPKRPLDAHKGTFGTALVVAGCQQYTGAAYLAGKAAYLSGAGLVTLAVTKPVHAALAGQFPEATWVILPDEMGAIADTAADVLRDNLQRATAILVGPGFGVRDTSARFLLNITQMSKSKKPVLPELPPMVVDADGIRLLAKLPAWQKDIPADSILTPHPGEMSILAGITVDQIQSDRVELAEQYSRKWGQVLVLKGAFSVVAAPDGRTGIIPVATPALARAGSGDVLAGLIAGLRAQGMGPFKAAAVGAWIHAQAGLRMVEVKGSTVSILAGDLLDGIVLVLADLAKMSKTKAPLY